MRILFLTQIVPYPPDAGPKVKTWNVLRYLHEIGHQIILATFIRPEERSHVGNLDQVCEQVHTVPIQRSRLKDVYHLFRSQISGRPFLIERDDIHEMRLLVENLVKTQSIDCVYSDQITMTQFAAVFLQNGFRNGNSVAESYRRPYVIYDAHNAVWTTVERMVDRSSWVLKPLVSLEASRVKRYQAKIVRDFDHTFAVTNVDRQNFLSANDELFSVNPNSLSEKVSVFPITVDTTILKPLVRQTGSLNILTLGSLHYPPNADGIRWFANEVFPMVRKQVPAASLTIVGKNPPPDLIRLASDNPEYIFVTGYVPHLDPYYERSSVVVVPVRAGSGMRVRILETFALGMPTVTTTVGLEGIDAIPGEDVLVADTADEFASAVIQLLLDPELQEKLAHRGRCLAESRYDVHVALKAIDHVFETLRQA